MTAPQTAIPIQNDTPKDASKNLCRQYMTANSAIEQTTFRTKVFMGAF